MPAETSQTIRIWGDATFGAPSDLTVLVQRARVEMDELEEALRAGDTAEAGREAADVVILLHRIAGILGHDLTEQVDAKMVINRARKWKSAGDGTGGHV
ncbi:MAG: nucleotide pyrophosphohydrolase [Rhizobiaceae bacterium]|nr:MAG: nucleotide pyrophosphohydrolase [Rhizobiaceae bacterium]